MSRVPGPGIDLSNQMQELKTLTDGLKLFEESKEGSDSNLLKMPKSMVRGKGAGVTIKVDEDKNVVNGASNDESSTTERLASTINLGNIDSYKAK